MHTWITRVSCLNEDSNFAGLLKCYTQYVSKFWKLSSGHRTGKCQFSFQSQRRTMPSSNYHTHVLISHASQVMLKIFQARIQQCLTWKFPNVQAGFQRGRGTRVQITTICWIMGKTRDSRKPSTSASLTMPKLLTVWITTKWNILKDRGILDHLTSLLRNFYAGQKAMDREQLTGSKLGKEYDKVLYCHSVV